MEHTTSRASSSALRYIMYFFYDSVNLQLKKIKWNKNLKKFKKTSKTFEIGYFLL